MASKNRILIHITLGVIQIGFCHANPFAQPNLPKQSKWIVQDNTTLAEISIRAYGTTRYWKKIARLNRMKPPYPVWIGRRLKLPRPIELTPDEGLRQVAEMWRLQKERQGGPPLETTNALAIEKLKQAESQNLVVFEDVDPSSEQLVADGKTDYENNQLTLAIEKFRKARKKSPDLLVAWFSEIKAHKRNQDNGSAKKTAEEFISEFPDQADLPLIQDALQPPTQP